ncbi:acyltransferase [soil metagenome]
MIPSSRTAGLDTLRAAAIALVFMYHYMCFVSQEATFGWLSTIGWEGVDLFFVLSGYLIANSVFAGLTRSRLLSVRRFYGRRALRTLPVFWLVLAAFLVFPGELGGRAAPPAWRFLTFTQNWALQPGTAFSHAWSLCVEEQFYLVLPLIVAAGVTLARRGERVGVRHGWALLAGLFTVGICARAMLWFQVDPAHGGDPDRFMTLIYYSTLCRFDEFVPGIAVAMLKNFHPAAWSRLMRKGRALLVTGLIGTIGMMAIEYGAANAATPGLLTTTFGYSLIAIFFACLVAAALSPATLLHRLRVPGAQTVALWSYSLYLSHRPVANLMLGVLRPLSVGELSTVIAITFACLLVGGALYVGVEAPFMRLRDHWIPSQFEPSVSATLPSMAAARS